MRIVHFSETDLGGGAGLTAYRLHRALLAQGRDSRFLVSRKFSSDPTVQEAFSPRLGFVRRRLRERLDRWPLARYPRRESTDFSTPWLNWGAWRAAELEQADIVHLHWTNLGFLGLEELRRFRAPVVWSFMDLWPFTGGCHYAGACDGYLRECGRCPLLHSDKEHDLSRRQFHRKRAAYARQRFVYTCLSQEALAFAQRSALLRDVTGHCLPMGVNVSCYQPSDPAFARRTLGLPAEGFLVAFSALRLDDVRKGGDLVAAAAQALAARVPADRLAFVTFGGGVAPESFGPYRVHHLGLLRDETSVALALAAADVTLVPSREDAGPSVTPESLACGTPVAGFSVGANRDLIVSGKNGYLADAVSAEALAAGLEWALGRARDPDVRAAARSAVFADHDVHRQAQRFLELYQRRLTDAVRA